MKIKVFFHWSWILKFWDWRIGQAPAHGTTVDYVKKIKFKSSTGRLFDLLCLGFYFYKPCFENREKLSAKELKAGKFQPKLL